MTTRPARDRWNDPTNPNHLVAMLRRGLGARAERPLRFFAVHAARTVLDAADPRVAAALDATERRLVGTATDDDAADAARGADAARAEAYQAWERYVRNPSTARDAAGRAERFGRSIAAHAAFHVATLGFYDGLLTHLRDARAFSRRVTSAVDRAALLADLCRILREVAPDPSRPITLRLEWRTETAVLLARQMYMSNDFSAAPVLADSLQDAGCDSADLLAHLREPHARHLRGCWAAEAVLNPPG